MTLTNVLCLLCSIISGQLAMMLMELTKRRYVSCLVFFFFQAEDGIRDLIVTGVQTCALPIFVETATRIASLLLDQRQIDEDVFNRIHESIPAVITDRSHGFLHFANVLKAENDRSEERRVGKECRSRWSPYH